MLLYPRAILSHPLRLQAVSISAAKNITVEPKAGFNTKKNCDVARPRNCSRGRCPFFSACCCRHFFAETDYNINRKSKKPSMG